MAEPAKLPETMLQQWRVFERALWAWAQVQRLDLPMNGRAMARLRTHYLLCAAPDGELRSDSHQAALTDLQDWAVLVAYRLAMRLLDLELRRAGQLAETSATALASASALPAEAGRQWRDFCGRVRRSAGGGYSARAVEAALTALVPLWPELARPLPSLTVWQAPGESERLLKHVNDWAFSKQLAMLQALARAECAVPASVPLGATAAAATAAVLPFPTRCDSADAGRLAAGRDSPSPSLLGSAPPLPRLPIA